MVKMVALEVYLYTQYNLSIQSAPFSDNCHTWNKHPIITSELNTLLLSKKTSKQFNTNNINIIEKKNYTI